MIRFIRDLDVLGWWCIILFVAPASLVLITLCDVINGDTKIEIVTRKHLVTISAPVK